VDLERKDKSKYWNEVEIASVGFWISVIWNPEEEYIRSIPLHPKKVYSRRDNTKTKLTKVFILL
jgi:hypothetical protein